VERNQPVGITDLFAPQTPRVCVFAQVEASQNLWFGIGWYRHGRIVEQQKTQHRSGYLHSCLEPKHTREFDPGKYEVVLWLGKSNLASAEFQITEDN
jgi:hypothetical protein